MCVQLSSLLEAQINSLNRLFFSQHPFVHAISPTQGPQMEPGDGDDRELKANIPCPVEPFRLGGPVADVNDVFAIITDACMDYLGYLYWRASASGRVRGSPMATSGKLLGSATIKPVGTFGNMYFYGRTVDADAARAASWWEKSITLGGDPRFRWDSFTSWAMACPRTSRWLASIGSTPKNLDPRMP